MTNLEKGPLTDVINDFAENQAIEYLRTLEFILNNSAEETYARIIYMKDVISVDADSIAYCLNISPIIIGCAIHLHNNQFPL